MPGAEHEVDVVVVGAGLSGLTAARELVRAGRTVRVLEARDRVGGKVWSPQVGGVAVDLGAHWVGRRHRRVRALAREAGLEVLPQRLRGRALFDLGGRRQAVLGETPLRPLTGTIETAVRVLALEARIRRIDRAAPWTSPGAAALDASTVSDWMASLRTDLARGALTAGLRTTAGLEPDEVSMLAFLSMARSSGGLTSLLRFRGGAQDAHVEGGAQGLAHWLAVQLGDSVRLGSPVSAVGQDDAGVAVVSASGTTTARAVIVATSPATVEQIGFSPALPAARRTLQGSMPLGDYTKAILTFDRPWWREAGRSGIAICDHGAVQMVVDVGPLDGGPGVLAAFVTGAAARDLRALAAPDRRLAVQQAVGALLGSAALHPVAYAEADWSIDPWSLGAPVGMMRPGTMTTVGHALRAPVGLVHWAGTDVAAAHAGYMEGAIIAGQAAAEAVGRVI